MAMTNNFINKKEEGHVHGNFNKYYEFNPAQERLKFITTEIRECLASSSSSSDDQLNICDVGCNEGNLTLALHHLFTGGKEEILPENHQQSYYYPKATSELNHIVQRENHVLEFIQTHHRQDIIYEHHCDLYLNRIFYGSGIGTSKHVARARASHEALQVLNRSPRTTTGTSTAANIPLSFKSKDVMTVTTPSSSSREVRTLGIDLDEKLIGRAREKNKKDTVVFEPVDVMTPVADSIVKAFLLPVTKLSFNIVCCFSITMWIHLNHGDSGLFAFLQKVSAWTNKHLILEPQPWKCYRKACQRLKRMQCPLPIEFSRLKHRLDVQKVIEDYLMKDCGFRTKQVLGHTGWTRKIMLFSK
mmetsp:Transcript_23759/g.54154  ORF Transcript_23759/g.54154 Transcript_23759/m.54154 type:complete len:358 (-) Transcript_23759:37-1110(-)